MKRREKVKGERNVRQNDVDKSKGLFKKDDKVKCNRLSWTNRLRSAAQPVEGDEEGDEQQQYEDLGEVEALGDGPDDDEIIELGINMVFWIISIIFQCRNSF